MARRRNALPQCEIVEETSHHRETERTKSRPTQFRIKPRRPRRLACRRLAGPSSSHSRNDGVDTGSTTRIGDRRIGRRAVRSPSAAGRRLGRRGVRASGWRPWRPRYGDRHPRRTVRSNAPDRACQGRLDRDRRRGTCRPRSRRPHYPRAAGARRHQRLVAHLAAAAAGVAGRMLRRRQDTGRDRAERTSTSARCSTMAHASAAISWSRPTGCIPRFARSIIPELAPRYAGYVAWRGVVEADALSPELARH